MATANTVKKAQTKSNFGHEKIKILYEDDYICVINKPSGLLSVPYPGSRAKTAESLLADIMRRNGSFNSKHRPFVVHRLDRDTSGVMMFALSENAQKVIMDTWHKMVTERLYHAVAENPRDKKCVLPAEGIIDDELAFNSHNLGFVPKEGDVPKHKGEKDSVYERHIEGTGSARKFKTVTARTHYRILERGATHTLFELSLDTGRKNQIRAHLASKGYVLAGDENYRARTDHFGRLCLHARTLEFDHPFTGEHMKFEVPENPEWTGYVKRGDHKPLKPVWLEEKTSFARPDNKPSKKQSTRLSARQKAHLNFIEQGKLR